MIGGLRAVGALAAAVFWGLLFCGLIGGCSANRREAQPIEDGAMRISSPATMWETRGAKATASSSRCTWSVWEAPHEIVRPADLAKWGKLVASGEGGVGESQRVLLKADEVFVTAGCHPWLPEDAGQ